MRQTGQHEQFPKHLSGDFLHTIGKEKATNQQIFDGIFPEQIDPGERRSTSWRWMMSRIRDGNNIKPPRNLIDLVIKSREAQLRREDRDSRDYVEGTIIIESDSVRRGLSQLSEDRVEDTLLAEAGESAPLIERFRGAKSEHDTGSLAKVLNKGSTD